MLHIHETVFWVDASIRFKTSNIEKMFNQMIQKSRGILISVLCAHNIFMATHKGMYQYLPIAENSAVKLHMYGTGAVFVRRSKEVDVFIVYIMPCCMQFISHAGTVDHTQKNSTGNFTMKLYTAH